MLFWGIRASIPTIYRENKAGCVFFKARLMVMPKYVEILPKSPKITKNWIFEKSDDGKRLSEYLQVRAARNVSCRKKEMILRRLGEGFGEGKGSG